MNPEDDLQLSEIMAYGIEILNIKTALYFPPKDRVKVLSDLVRELQKARDENVSHMNTMNSFSDKIISEEKLSIQNRVRHICV